MFAAPRVVALASAAACRAVTLRLVNAANATQPSVEDVVLLLASANDPAVGFTGVFSEVESGHLRRRWRVWRLRELARIEDPPGHMSLLAGKTHYWRSWPIDDGVTRIPRDPEVRFDFDLSALAMPDPVGYYTTWLGEDPELVASTLRRVKHHGRLAWTFTAPRVKGGSSVLTVDAELGLVLRAERSDLGFVREWSELTVDPTLDAAFFDYDTT